MEMDKREIIRKNLLIIDNAVILLAELLLKERKLYDDEKNENFLRKLMNDEKFNIDAKIDINVNQLYNICGIERSSICKARNGSDVHVTKKMKNFFLENQLMDEAEVNKFAEGDLQIVLNNMEKSDAVFDKYFKESDCIRKKQKKEIKESANKIVKTKGTRDNNKIYNDKIKSLIVEYLKNDKACKSVESLDEDCLSDNWLFLYLRKICEKIQMGGEPIKKGIQNLKELQRSNFETLNMQELEKVIKDLRELYENAYALYRCRKWK